MKITENFEYIGTQQNFERDSYATLAEMKDVVDKRMPDIFTATCKETGKLYIYNKNNEVDETFGKWREISVDSDDYVTKTYLDTELAKKSNIDHTHTTVNGHTVESNVPADAKFTDTVLEINDTNVSETTVWSSHKTSDEIGILINNSSTGDTNSTWSSSKIVSEITNEATTRQNTDTALQSALALRKSYDFVVDSNETLLAWANCTDGSMKSVLVKSGEYTLDGKEINLVNAGTKFVFAEVGNKINVINYLRGIGATEDYGAVIVGLNVKVNYTGNKKCFAFYGGMICYSCTGDGTVKSFATGSKDGYGFYNCTCSNCTGNGTGSTNGYGFYNCTCSNCTGNGTGIVTGYGFYNCTCSNCTGTGTGINSGIVTGCGFYKCTCSNCTGTGTGCGDNGSGNSYGSGFSSCTCSNCIGTGTGTGTGTGYGFYNCSYCSSCRAGKTASTTATWGGTNTYIDSDSCDYVAS